MEWKVADLLTLALIVITGAYVILTGLILRTMQEESRKATAARVHDLLWRLLMEYRSVEMLLAVDSLWQLHRDHPTDLADEYERIRNRERAAIQALPSAQQSEATSGCLHHRRRLVSHFYQFLAAIREREAIPDGILYAHWVETDLKVLPTIVIPIEERLAQELQTDSAHFQAMIRRLHALHEGSLKANGGV